MYIYMAGSGPKTKGRDFVWMSETVASTPILEESTTYPHLARRGKKPCAVFSREERRRAAAASVWRFTKKEWERGDEGRGLWSTGRIVHHCHCRCHSASPAPPVRGSSLLFFHVPPPGAARVPLAGVCDHRWMSPGWCFAAPVLTHSVSGKTRAAPAPPPHSDCGPAPPSSASRHCRPCRGRPSASH